MMATQMKRETTSLEEKGTVLPHWQTFGDFLGKQLGTSVSTITGVRNCLVFEEVRNQCGLMAKKWKYMKKTKFEN